MCQAHVRGDLSCSTSCSASGEASSRWQRGCSTHVGLAVRMATTCGGLGEEPVQVCGWADKAAPHFGSWHNKERCVLRAVKWGSWELVPPAKSPILTGGWDPSPPHSPSRAPSHRISLQGRACSSGGPSFDLLLAKTAVVR